MIETVEEAVGDIDGLHSKIDRKKNVEQNNEMSFIDFRKVRDYMYYTIMDLEHNTVQSCTVLHVYSVSVS